MRKHRPPSFSHGHCRNTVPGPLPFQIAVELRIVQRLNNVQHRIASSQDSATQLEIAQVCCDSQDPTSLVDGLVQQ